MQILITGVGYGQDGALISHFHTKKDNDLCNEDGVYRTGDIGRKAQKNHISSQNLYIGKVRFEDRNP